MPSASRKQQKFFQAELGRKREGKKTKTGLSEETLSEFASSIDTSQKKKAGKQNSPFQKVNPPGFIAAGKLGKLSV